MSYKGLERSAIPGRKKKNRRNENKVNGLSSTVEGILKTFLGPREDLYCLKYFKIFHINNSNCKIFERAFYTFALKSG